MKEDLLDKEKAQEKYCKEHGYMVLVPYYGTCFRCGQNIWKKISVEEAGKRYITGCPYCGRSWCD